MVTAERRELEAHNWRAMKRAYGWYLAMSLAVALLAPNDVLSSWPLLARFVNWMASFIPAIANLAAVSAFPEVTQLVGVLLWIGFPIVTVHFFSLLRFPSMQPTFRQWAIFGIGLPIVIAVIIFATFFLPRPPSPEYMNYTSGRGTAAATFMARSRFGLGLSSLAMIVNSLLIAAVGRFLLSALFRNDDLGKM